MNRTNFIMATALFMMLALNNQLFSQNVGINNNGSMPDQSAILDVNANDKGVLFPKIALLGVNDNSSIPNPATGLMIFNTTSGSGLSVDYFYNSGTPASPVWTKFVTTEHYIGENFGGGVIFYLDASKKHGLIAAKTDQATGNGVKWEASDLNLTTAATLDCIRCGRPNTTKIITLQGSGSYAAQVCEDYVTIFNNEYYDDWYLPSQYELGLLYQQKALVGGFTNTAYWSSNESSPNLAFYTSFSNGTQAAIDKRFGLLVRAIRAF